jgi:hypothetical protein
MQASTRMKRTSVLPTEIICAIFAQFLRQIYIEEGNVGRTDEQLLEDVLKASQLLASVWYRNKIHIKALARHELDRLLGDRMGYWILPPRPQSYNPTVPAPTIRPAVRHPRVRRTK